MKRYIRASIDQEVDLYAEVDKLLTEVNEYASQYGLVYRYRRDFLYYTDNVHIDFYLDRIPFHNIVLARCKLKSLLVPDMWSILEYATLKFWYNINTGELTEPALIEPNWGHNLSWKQMIDATAVQIDQFRNECDRILQLRRKHRRGRKAKNETLHT